MISEEVGQELLGTRPPWEPGTWRPSSCTLSVSLSSVSFLKINCCGEIILLSFIFLRSNLQERPNGTSSSSSSSSRKEHELMVYCCFFFKTKGKKYEYQVSSTVSHRFKWTVKYSVNERSTFSLCRFLKKKIKSCIFFNFTNSFIFEFFYISVTSIFWSEYFHMVHTRYKSFDTKIIYFCTCEKILMTSHWH